MDLRLGAATSIQAVDLRPSDDGFSSAGDRPAPGTATIFDSQHFGGLAGQLNLLVDTSTGTPYVDGVALSETEALRIEASNNEAISGLTGRVSIRFSF